MLLGYGKTSLAFDIVFKQDLLLALNSWARMILSFPDICNNKHVVTKSAKSRFFLLLFLRVFEFGPHVVQAHLGTLLLHFLCWSHACDHAQLRSVFR